MSLKMSWHILISIDELALETMIREDFEGVLLLYLARNRVALLEEMQLCD